MSVNYSNAPFGEGPTTNQIDAVTQFQKNEAEPNIKSIEQRMKTLYTQLESAASDGSGDNTQQINSLQSQISALSKAHETIVSGMQQQLQLLNTQVGQSREEVVDQATLGGVMEQELDNAKTNINAIKTAKDNKLRMTEINTYYSKRYQAHISLMKLIIIISVILLFLAIFRKKAYIGNDLAKWLSITVLIIGALMVTAKVIDMIRRDNMNYDEYNFYSLMGGSTGTTGDTVWEYDKKQLQGGWDNITDTVDNIQIDVSLNQSSANSESFKNNNNTVTPYNKTIYTRF